MKKMAVFIAVAACCAGSAFAATLTLVAPDGGELCLGRVFNIAWTATGIPAGTRVKLVLFQGETRIGTIAQDLGVGASPYRWTVGHHDAGTAASGSRYRIRENWPAGGEDGEEEGSGTSRPVPLPRACPNFGHTPTEARAVVANAQEPGPPQAVASGHWPASSKSAFSLS